MEKRRPREVKALVRDPTASKWQRQDLTPGLMLVTSVLSHEELAIDHEATNWAGGIGVGAEGLHRGDSCYPLSTCPMPRAVPILSVQPVS